MGSVPFIFSPKPEGFSGPMYSTSPRGKLLIKPETEGSLAAARLSTADGLGVDFGQAGGSGQVRAGVEVPGSLGEGTKRNSVAFAPFS